MGNGFGKYEKISENDGGGGKSRKIRGEMRENEYIGKWGDKNLVYWGKYANVRKSERIENSVGIWGENFTVKSRKLCENIEKQPFKWKCIRN